MTRSRALLSVIAVMAASAAVSSTAARALTGAEAPRMTQCAQADGNTFVGAPWTIGETSSVKWYLLASVTTTCAEARRLLPELSRRTASSGSVSRVAFTIGGWSCAATREFRQGGCSILVKGQQRYVVAMAVNQVSQITALTLARGQVDATAFAPPATSPTSSPSTPPASADAYRGTPARRCTSVAGRRWQFPDARPAGYRSAYWPEGQSGDRWAVYALGGLGCIAAQGWVADLSPRILTPSLGMGGLRTDDGWSCSTGGRMLAGVCIRPTSPRGPLDFRGVIITPDVAQESFPFSPVAYEDVLHAMLSFNAAFESDRVEPRVCDTPVVPSARWTVGAASGTRWAVGVRGGYWCGLVLGPELARLAEWAASPPGNRTGGVDGGWRCITYVSSQVHCRHFGSATSFRIALVPYQGDPAAARDAVIRALR